MMRLSITKHGACVTLILLGLVASAIPLSTAAAPAAAKPAMGLTSKGGGGSGSGSSGSGSGTSGSGGSCALCKDGLAPLNTLGKPVPSGLSNYVRDQTAALQLGKALFWDSQLGGDGAQACASCHFASGADTRVRNQLNPRKTGQFDPNMGADYTLTASDFPMIGGVADGYVVGSQGLTQQKFTNLSGSPVDNCLDVADTVFHTPSGYVRQVTGRNAPSAVNAVFNFHNFWDGRANNSFNGVSPFGSNDSGARIWKIIKKKPTQVQISLSGASLASQAVGPPNNGVEMSCDGRTFPQLGRKMLGLTPLGQQQVAFDDSTLGALVNGSGVGLNTSYANLIKKAFQPAYWDTTKTVSIGGQSFSVMEANFSLFFGLAVDLYESTLVSDQTPFDKFAAGNTAALTQQQQDGLLIFEGDGRCSHCHNGPALTEATENSSGGFKGFANIGVRPTAEDLGAGAITGDAELNGAFKIPGLRNVELTGPYFHNGSRSTLRQVVEFYNRGGDFANPEKDSQIRQLGLSGAQMDALVAFMLSLTDPRVKNQSAPFDHPALVLHNGGGADTTFPAVGRNGNAGAPLATFLNLDAFAP